MYAYFNVVHILYLLLPIILLVCFYNIFKDKSHKVQTIFLLCCVGISATISCVVDVFQYVPTEGWRSVFKNLPLYPCDLNNFILPIALLKKKKNTTLDKYVMYFVTTGPIYTLLAPIAENNIYYFYDYTIWGTFLAHSLYIAVAVLYLKFNHVKCSSRQPWKMWLIMMVMITVAHAVNLALIFTGINPNANYCFTGHPPEVGIAYRAAVLVGYNNPYIRCYFFMVIGYTGMTIIYYFVHKLTETGTAAKLNARIKAFFASIKGKTNKKELTDGN